MQKMAANIILQSSSASDACDYMRTSRVQQMSTGTGEEEEGANPSSCTHQIEGRTKERNDDWLGE